MKDTIVLRGPFDPRPRALLVRELAERNLTFAQQHGLRHEVSLGSGVVVYLPHPDDTGSLAHGNFYAPAYRAICAHPEWVKRTLKVHTGRKSLPRAFNHAGDVHAWLEMDSSSSSDALLMSVFGAPGVAGSKRMAALLHVGPGCAPRFGIDGRAALAKGFGDTTEVDMRLGDLMVEAKLTEANFTARPLGVFETYADFASLFDAALLPRDGKGLVHGYQLVRNILAAHKHGFRFCLIADARRPDLREQYVMVQRALTSFEMRLRCTMLTWQEVTSACPAPLRRWLAEKYGIEAAITAR